MKNKIQIIVVMLILLFPGLAGAEKEYPFWRLVAKSVLIVEGTLEVPVAEIQKAAETGEHDYVVVNIAVQANLKREAESPSVTFRYYTDTETYGGVTRDQITALNGKAAVVFLQKVGENYYLAAYAPETVQPAGETLAARVRDESTHQETLILESEQFISQNMLPRETELQSLIELMVSHHIDPAGAQEVYEAVISLGKEAVPTIIKYMDDRRKLRIPKITLEPWWPDAHEGLVHYGPETVVDVLSVALMVLTSEDLTAIYNGGTELERAEAVRTWKIYERRMYGSLVKH